MTARASDGCYPNGHFYSPVPDPGELIADAARIWPEGRGATPGLDFNDDGHRQLLVQAFAPLAPDYNYPAQRPPGAPEHDFFDGNPNFAYLDSRALFVLMRHWQPGRIVEVGSGHSSLLMADVNRRFLAGRCEITCIEPFPPDFLRDGVPGIGRLLVARVQDVPLATFEGLHRGDVLFIDSSHVSKAGSDVNHLLFEVLPRLAQGVRVHFHDIFLPFDYPRSWVLEHGIYWNEQYLLRAMLTGTTTWSVLFGSTYAGTVLAEDVNRALGLPAGSQFTGGSFWIEKRV